MPLQDGPEEVHQIEQHQDGGRRDQGTLAGDRLHAGGALLGLRGAVHHLGLDAQVQQHRPGGQSQGEGHHARGVNGGDLFPAAGEQAAFVVDPITLFHNAEAGNGVEKLQHHGHQVQHRHPEGLRQKTGGPVEAKPGGGKGGQQQAGGQNQLVIHSGRGSHGQQHQSRKPGLAAGTLPPCQHQNARRNGADAHDPRYGVLAVDAQLSHFRQNRAQDSQYDPYHGGNQVQRALRFGESTDFYGVFLVFHRVFLPLFPLSRPAFGTKSALEQQTC